MAGELSVLERVDAAIEGLLAEWSIFTSVIAAALVLFGIYSVVSIKDPDVHPFLLARQSTGSPIRQAGESATFRGLETPYGYPLRQGLGVKDPGTPKWTAGRRGDLRDIWRTAVRGALNEDGTTSGKQGKIYTVLGKRAVEHTLGQVTQEINVIGRHFQKAGVKTVAVCLTDSIEHLASIFAGSFFGFRVVLVPHGLPAATLSAQLQKNQADALIAEAGSLDLTFVTRNNKQLSAVLWVAHLGNQHMDWHQVPKDVETSLDVAVWHELVEEGKDIAGFEVPEYDPAIPAPGLSTVWAFESETGEFINFTQENLVAAIGALGSALPRNQRVNASDLVLSIDSLSRSYPLCQIFNALYSNASIALNSVAGENVDFALATKGVSPTVIIASSRTMSEYHDRVMAPRAGFITSLGRWLQARTLDAGNMPSNSFLNQLTHIAPTAELSLGKLRLLCISHRVDADPATRLTTEQMTDLRIYMNARVVYALTGPGIAGAITQTNVFDYRNLGGWSHFGAPLSSTEITLIGVAEDGNSDDNPQGEILVSGPAVVNEKVKLPFRGRIGIDNTLTLNV
ncbi:hypothetical protein N7539_000065 [Penicillium diatomitis]|uniref:AMP-dependent synthetase/ligase domain-containing protein n=1 Tax=Penicillium diatomitis TaxID=2819901 RepID=A0A9X0C2D5_9EURO|nr:uncharacterized protein N7539_000065 [Penicillium diatomitis]KAJ5494949.1 hypothetical protein N7539_000065 [Penicillium diatomitis]